MTQLPTLRALILAAAAVASPLLALSLPAAAAGQGPKMPASATHAAAGADGVKSPTTGTKTAGSGMTPKRDHRDRIIRDHRGVERKHPRARPICAGWAC